MLKIWSKRFSVAYGNHWRYERDTTEENAEAWLSVFRKDEPGIIFLASKKKPNDLK